MADTLTSPDHKLIDGYYKEVLKRHAEGRWDQSTALTDLAETFSLLARDNPTWRNHMKAVLEETA